jgi:SAM-dependent methyltransferase
VSVDPNWFEGFFESEWLDYLALGRKSTEAEVDLLVEELGIGPGSRVLDLACGRGRIAIPLAQRGMRVTGVDLSPRSLELARRDAATAGVALELIESDMREIDFDPEFDAAYNVYSSFGYFEEQADDERVLHAVARSLKRGGAFLIDTVNPIALERVFHEREWREFDDGTLMLEQIDHDRLAGRHNTTWTFVRPDGTRSEQRFSLRLYTAPELCRMFAAAGLDVDGAWGSWQRTDLGDGLRTILRGRRR